MDKTLNRRRFTSESFLQRQIFGILFYFLFILIHNFILFNSFYLVGSGESLVRWSRCWFVC